MRLVLAIAVAVPSYAGAQIRSSERGMASQTVDGTVITVDYARPQARGRRVIFGVVYWGRCGRRVPIGRRPSRSIRTFS